MASQNANQKGVSVRAYLYRSQRPDCLLGGLSFGAFQCYTLELPYRNNEPEISAIPEAVYQCGLRPSAKFGNWTGGMIYHLQPVQGRTDILIHAGNSVADTHGCILIGDSWRDDNGKTVVTNSRKTLMALHEFTKGQPFTLAIVSS